jgi:hypothetical protein
MELTPFTGKIYNNAKWKESLSAGIINILIAAYVTSIKEH